MMILRSLSGSIAEHEIWVSALIIALLLFPNGLPVLALLLIPVPWVCRWVSRGHLSRRTPLDLPILLLVLLTPVTLWATALPEITWPAVRQLVAGVTLFYGIVNWARDEARICWTVWGLVALGTALALVAPFGIRWSPGKLFAAVPLYSMLPTLLPESIHPNVVAGALAILCPLPLALLVLKSQQHLTASADQPFSALCKRVLSRRSRVRRCALVLALALMLSTLLATQSRGACAAAVLAIGFVLASRNPWFVCAGVAVLGGLGYVGCRTGAVHLLDLMIRTESMRTLEGRLEVWSRAQYMMEDFPFTGVGMGAFNRVANAMYPFFLAGPEAEVPHPHNLFLQIGVDLGYPGLIAFISVLFLALVMAWQTYRCCPRLRGLASGLLGGYIALIVHGLVDAVSWGTKPAIIVWALFGLTGALHNVSYTPVWRADKRQSLSWPQEEHPPRKAESASQVRV